MKMVNKYNKDSFDSLEKAKQYYYPTDEVDANIKNPDNYSGDDFEGYLANWEEYKAEISEAKSLNELADVLTKWSDWFDNGSEYEVIE